MTYEEMAKSSLEARDKYFAVDIGNPIDFTSECGDCPAAKACEVLSEGRDFKAFCISEDRLTPLMEEMVVRSTNKEH